VSVVSLPANLTALARDTGETALRLTGRMRHWFWRFLVAMGAAWAVSPLVAPGKLFALVAATLGVGGLYAALMIPLALRDPLGVYVRPRIGEIRAWLLKPSVGNADA
jgi:hypothetical protein